MRAGAVVLAATALVAALYGQAVTLWWTFDDAFLLRVAATSSVRQHFLSPDFWHSQPNQQLFPVLLVVLKAMTGSFGTEAAPLYVAGLASMIALAVLLYALLRLWMMPLVAGAGALLVLAGTPMCEMAASIATINYLHALALATAAAIAHVIGVRRQSLMLSAISAMLYLLALVTKEIALPLPLLLVLLPERRPALAFAMHLEALAVFVTARTVLVGGAFTAYGFAVQPADLPSLAVAMPWQVIRAVLGPAALVAVALAAMLIGAIVPALRDRRLALGAAICIAVSIAGTLPVAKAIEPRHAVLLWLTLAIVFVIAAQTRWMMIAGVFALVLIANRGQWAITMAAAQRQSSEGRAFVSLGPGDALAYPAIPPAAMAELNWLKTARLGGVAGADWFYDDLFLCEGRGAAVRRFVAWRADTRSVETIVPEPRCDQAREAPLSLAFRHRENMLFWTFGPYRDGRWSVLMDGGRQSFVVPAADSFHVPGLRALSVQIRYDSPEGWRTYSPVMALDFARQPAQSFTR